MSVWCKTRKSPYSFDQRRRRAAAVRAGELVTLRWDAVDFVRGCLHVGRLKNGATSVHPLSGRELRALRRLKREGVAQHVRMHRETEAGRDA